MSDTGAIRRLASSKSSAGPLYWSPDARIQAHVGLESRCLASVARGPLKGNESVLGEQKVKKESLDLQILSLLNKCDTLHLASCLFTEGYNTLY